MADTKIEGLPPLGGDRPNLADVHHEAPRGRGQDRAPEGQGYDHRDAKGSVPPTRGEAASPKTSGMLDTPRSARPTAAAGKVSPQELDAARREVQARGLKGSELDACVAVVREAATTLGVPVREVTPAFTGLLDAVGPAHWDFAKLGLEMSADWARKRRVSLDVVVDSLKTLVEHEGPASAYDALADLVMVGIATGQARISINEATRALVTFRELEGPVGSVAAQDDLKAVCDVATAKSFAPLSQALAKNLSSGNTAAERAALRRAFVALHQQP